jgi:hypothetical protein
VRYVIYRALPTQKDKGLNAALQEVNKWCTKHCAVLAELDLASCKYVTMHSLRSAISSSAPNWPGCASPIRCAANVSAQRSASQNKIAL